MYLIYHLILKHNCHERELQLPNLFDLHLHLLKSKFQLSVEQELDEQDKHAYVYEVFKWQNS